MMITPVGTAYEGLLWAQHTWRNWFWAAQVTLGRTSILQWGSSSGCWWMVANAKVHGIFKFIPLWDKCISVHGDYVEKQWYFSVI